MGDHTTKLIAAAIALGGTALLIAIFALTMRSSDPHRDNLLSVKVGDLKPGTMMMLDSDALRYFIINPSKGDIYVIAVPTDEGKVPMPEAHWWSSPIMRCKDFGLHSGGTLVNAESRFGCRDADLPVDWARRWQWDIHGKHAAEGPETPLDSMYRVRIERSGSKIVFLSLETE